MKASKALDRLACATVRPLANTFVQVYCRRRKGHRSCTIAAQVRGMQSDLWALDFDGVVCNSVGESSKSAWQVNKSLMRCVFDNVGTI
jgi:hypothetical protein